ncbi:hypothetical protein PQX77_022047 [Marasmius sp. AFHP31]|nr:hypothetical protein PQX77_022047 [Marasmius sp. AFHP31]
MDKPQCPPTKEIGILSLVADILSDLVLVLIPLRLIQTLSSRSLRRRLAWIFSTAIITTAASIPHTVFIIMGMGPEQILSGYVQASVALIVSNLPIVATKVIQKLRDRATSPEGRSRWTSVQFASEAPAGRETGDTERGDQRSRAEYSANGAIGIDTTGGSDCTAATRSWLRWDRDLRDEDPPSPPRFESRRPSTIDLGNITPHREETNSSSGHPTSFSERLVATRS